MNADQHVQFGTDRRGRPTFVFSFAYDGGLVDAVRRLPDRRFSWDAREWTVPRRPDTALEVADLLRRHPRLVADPAVSEWLVEACRWCAKGAAWDAGDGLVVGIHTRTGRAPAWLRDAALEERDGWLIVAPDPDLAAVDGLELDPIARDVAGGAEPPGAGLEVGTDDEGAEQFELHVGTWIAAAAEFRCLPEAAVARVRDGGYALAEQRDVLGVPADPALLDALEEFLDRNADHVTVSPAAEARAAVLRAERRRAKATIALSLADDAELDLPALGGTLRPFQRAGVAYALDRRGTFLADEQGLGKTVQALAAIEAAGAYPAVVVCPASLKLTWQREAARWLPHRTTTTVHGRRAAIERADLVIVNYDVVEAHVETLAARAPRAAVFDESHYCKDPRARRTKACLALAASLPEGALRLALTGTPILNRPKELVPQLRLIGRLADFGSGAGLARRFRGPQSHERLHWHLRAHCYVRRLKADVLPQLPAKRQVTIPVELTNRAEYELAERDLIAWLRQQPLDLGTMKARVAAARRSQRLVRLNHLRRLAARGKLAAALDWVGDFLASGEPLVVFASHVEVQRALVARHPGAAHILGADDAEARDRAVTAFARAGGPQLIVCSLRAAGQGLTLTRASNVAFVELDWTPARLEQAEDRCHRIGQDDAVTAWYLVAPSTIDDTMAGLLEQKRGVIGAITDGRPEASESIVEAVVRDLRGRPPAIGDVAEAA